MKKLEAPPLFSCYLVVIMVTYSGGQMILSWGGGMWLIF